MHNRFFDELQHPFSCPRFGNISEYNKYINDGKMLLFQPSKFLHQKKGVSFHSTKRIKAEVGMKKHIQRALSAFVIGLIILTITPTVPVEASYGYVVISGQVTYQPRNWNAQNPNWQVGREM